MQTQEAAQLNMVK